MQELLIHFFSRGQQASSSIHKSHERAVQAHREEAQDGVIDCEGNIRQAGCTDMPTT